MSKLLKAVWRRMLRVAYPLYEPDRPKLDWGHWEIAAKRLRGEVDPPALPAAGERVRRNLLAVSTLAFVLLIGGLTTDNPGVQLNGVMLPSLGPGWIAAIVSVVLWYQIIHYYWLFSDLADAWRVKLSGLRADAPDLLAQKRHNGAVKPEHQTLYAWWHEHSRRVDSWGELQFDLQSLKEQLKRGRTADVETPLKRIDEQIKEIRIVLGPHLISGSLANFDNFHKRLTRSQMLRWLVMDYYLPVVVGVASAIGLMYSALTLWP